MAEDWKFVNDLCDTVDFPHSHAAACTHDERSSSGERARNFDADISILDPSVLEISVCGGAKSGKSKC